MSDPLTNEELAEAVEVAEDYRRDREWGQQDVVRVDALVGVTVPRLVAEVSALRTERDEQRQFKLDWRAAAEAARSELEVKDRQITELRALADEAQLRSIEARNPGIDMDEVRRGVLAAGGDTSNPPTQDDEWTVRIPADPEQRAALAKFAGLTDDEKAALDQWCYDEEQQRARGVLMHETETRADGSFPEPTTTERSKRFNETCGTHGYTNAQGMRVGGNEHPDRCVCQSNDTTPHKHYRDAPYSCARCLKCEGYEPAVSVPVTTEGT